MLFDKAPISRRPRPPVLAVELQEVKGVEKSLAVVSPAVQLLEHRHARVIANDCLAVDTHR
jgi:hypothetical protein